MAQGAFSVVRGGNFWQGAAAGAFSSLAGSAFQAWCPIDIANSFGGVTAYSAVVGGAGAYLGGARSPAEILMGVAAGAMVGALNAALHPVERVDASKIKVDLEPKMAHINNKDAYTVRAALKHPDQVAKIVKAKYLQMYGVKLNISNSSLTNEIMLHAIAYKLTEFSFNPSSKASTYSDDFQAYINFHSSISDCGEGTFLGKVGDSNRWFWDLFSGNK